MRKIILGLLLLLVFASVGFALDYVFHPTAITSKTADYTATSSDSFIKVVTSGGIANLTVTLPTISSILSDGFSTKTYKIMKNDASFNKVIVKASGSDTIDGKDKFQLQSEYEYVILSSSPDGRWTTDWKSNISIFNAVTVWLPKNVQSVTNTVTPGSMVIGWYGIPTFNTPTSNVANAYIVNSVTISNQTMTTKISGGSTGAHEQDVYVRVILVEP